MSPCFFLQAVVSLTEENTGTDKMKYAQYCAMYVGEARKKGDCT